MKKIFYILAIAATTLLASCQKETVGGTALQEMCGQWYVQVDMVDADGEVVCEDFNEGRSILLTYNTASNSTSEIYVDDLEEFWTFKVKVPCTLSSKTFGSSSPVQNEAYDCGVTLSNGKIVPNGTTTPSNMPADYIEFLITFDDDDLADYGYPGYSWLDFYGAVAYKVSGWRYTGFANDD